MMALAWWRRSWPKPRFQVCQQAARTCPLAVPRLQNINVYISKCICPNRKIYLSFFCFRCASRRPEPRPSVLPRNHPTPILLLSPWPSTQGKRQNIWFWGVLLGKKAIHNSAVYILHCCSPFKQMTLSEIYLWIMSTFPYYKANRYLGVESCAYWGVLENLFNIYGNILELM